MKVLNKSFSDALPGGRKRSSDDDDLFQNLFGKKDKWKYYNFMRK